jgi:hypothetical protein
MKRIGLALAICLLSAGAARAQTVLHEQNRFASPQNWAIELRAGPYLPEIDSEFPGTENPPFQKYFGTDRKVMFQLEVDYQFTHIFGSAAVGAQVGYQTREGKARTAAGDESGDTTSFLLVPVSLQLVYRMDEAALRWGIPLVPYVKAGLSYSMWRITDANGEVSRSETGQKGKGGTPGWQAAAGIALLLDFIDPASARALDADTGVNHTYVFAEVARYEASGLGRKKALKVGDSTWIVGLMFEF